MKRQAKLISFFQTRINNMDGFITESPDPVKVIEANSFIRIAYTPTIDGILGKIRKDENGIYHIRLSDKLNYYENTINTSIYRERFTIAHEIGHYIEMEYRDHILDILAIKSEEFEYIREQVCDIFASTFLMPATALRKECHDLFQKKTHPYHALKALTKKFKVNASSLIPQLVRTGACMETDWMFTVFKYGYNPAKRDDVKWRLAPGNIVLPRGLNRSQIERENDIVVYSNPGFSYTGLDTMNLCKEEWAKKYEWKLIYGQIRELAESGQLNNNPKMPWYDLNFPPSLDNSSSQADVARNHITLQPRKLGQAAATGILPVTSALFRNKDEIPPIGSNEWLDWKNATWRLSVDELDLFGWTRKNGESYMLVTGILSLQKRKK